MPFSRALNQPLYFPAVIALVLISILNASAADQTPRKPPSYGQETERLILNPQNLEFGSVSAGEQKVQTATITNAGYSRVTLLQVVGQGPDFTLSGVDLPLTLASGESFTFTVIFSPRSPGKRSGNISFISEEAGIPYRIMLGGYATERQEHDAHPVAITAQGHSVDLRWHASKSKGVMGYNIYRGTRSGGPYRKINSVLDVATVYTDTSVVDGTTYYYVATAVNSKEEESVYSKQARAVVP